MAWNRTNPRTIAEAANHLRTFLVENGPSSKGDILSHMGWGPSKLKNVLASQPDWLVVSEVRKVGTGKTPLYAANRKHVLGYCTNCKKKNFHPSLVLNELCFTCNSETKAANEYWTDEELEHIDPNAPCEYPPGSVEKSMVLAKRYASGVLLWNAADKLDHDTERVVVEDEECFEDDWEI